MELKLHTSPELPYFPSKQRPFLSIIPLNLCIPFKIQPVQSITDVTQKNEKSMTYEENECKLLTVGNQCMTSVE